jgi:hypothetical protein
VTPVDRAILQGLQALFETRSRLPENRVFSGFDPGHIGPHRSVDHHPEIGRAARHVDRIGAGEQGFCRNAAGIDAGAPNNARSTMATVMPAAASLRANAGPACPVPMMMAS